MYVQSFGFLVFMLVIISKNVFLWTLAHSYRTLTHSLHSCLEPWQHNNGSLSLAKSHEPPMTQCGNHTRHWLHYGSTCIISVTKHWKKDHNKTVTAQSGGDSLKLEAGQRPGTKVWRKTVATINWWNSWRRGSRPGGRSPEQVWRKRNRVESEMSRVSECWAAFLHTGSSPSGWRSRSLAPDIYETRSLDPR